MPQQTGHADLVQVVSSLSVGEVAFAVSPAGRRNASCLMSNSLYWGGFVLFSVLSSLCLLGDLLISIFCVCISK